MLYQSCLFDVSPYPNNVYTKLVLSSQRFSVRGHAHIRLTVRVIRHDLAETEKRGVNYIALGWEFALKAHSTLYSACEDL